jgi:iron-sulfur cluster repair protein YtfE (RIC family)
MNIEELAFKDRITLAQLNELVLLDIIEFLQLDRKQWINQFTKTHNEGIEIQKENQELKKQLENKYEKVGTLTSELLYEENTKLINQQKEFIKYLEDEIKKEKEDLEHLCDLYKIPQKNNSTYKFVYSYINKIEKILQKYKEITQTKSDKSV